MNTNQLILQRIDEMSGTIGQINGIVKCYDELKQSIGEIKTDISMVQQCYAVMGNDMKHIVADNVEFKNGTNKNITNLKTDHYKLKDTVNRQLWFAGGIAATIGGAWAMFVAWLKN